MLERIRRLFRRRRRNSTQSKLLLDLEAMKELGSVITKLQQDKLYVARPKSGLTWADTMKPTEKDSNANS